MEVGFTPDEEARLREIADHSGRDVHALVRNAAIRLIEEDNEFREFVRAGVAAADRGEFIDEEEMEARIRRMLQS